MKQNLENKLSMYDTVMLVLLANAAIVALRPALLAAQTALKGIILAIRAADQKQQSAITGVTQDKAVLRLLLVDQVFSVASALKAFAAFGDNNTLFEAANFSVTDLRRLSDEILPQTAQNIHDLANTNIASLADYGVTAAVLTALQTSIDDYKDIISNPRKAISERKTQTDLLPELFKESDDLMHRQMDPITKTLLATEPVFVSDYFNARITVNAGVHHTSLEGTVTVKDFGDLIVGAMVKIVELDRDDSTGVDGKYIIQEFKSGIYNVTVVADSYVPVKIPNVEIGLGKIVGLNVEMVKAA